MVHQYKNNGYNIVLDVNSGMVHVVDDLAYDVIEVYESKTKEEIIQTMLEKYEAAGITETDVKETIEEIQFNKLKDHLDLLESLADEDALAEMDNISYKLCLKSCKLTVLYYIFQFFRS